MSNHNILLDAHDRAYVHAITKVRYERPLGRGKQFARDKDHISGGELLRRLVYHLNLFKDELLPVLAVPPVVCERRPLCVVLTDAERAMWQGLAAARFWSMTDLARALVAYHWELREQFRLSTPGLREVGRMGQCEFLSFQPDRRQPWYYAASEQMRRLEERSKEDQSHLVEILRAWGVDEKVVENVIFDFEESRTVRRGYSWEEKYMSPEEVRHAEYKSEGGML